MLGDYGYFDEAVKTPLILCFKGFQVSERLFFTELICKSDAPVKKIYVPFHKKKVRACNNQNIHYYSGLL